MPARPGSEKESNHEVVCSSPPPCALCQMLPGLGNHPPGYTQQTRCPEDENEDEGEQEKKASRCAKGNQSHRVVPRARGHPRATVRKPKSLLHNAALPLARLTPVRLPQVERANRRRSQRGEQIKTARMTKSRGKRRANPGRTPAYPYLLST